MKKILFLLLVIGGGWHYFTSTQYVVLGPGVMATAIPQQTSISSPKVHRVNEYSITEVASFNIKAKVLSRKNYSLGRESDLSPVDLALGWGNMSDESVLDEIDISQSGRWYRWYVKSFPIPRREIETHSANMHLIPSSDHIHDAIDEAHAGDIIELTGSLVSVVANDGWSWKSSLTRNDTGGSACELIWVEQFKVVSP